MKCNLLKLCLMTVVLSLLCSCNANKKDEIKSNGTPSKSVATVGDVKISENTVKDSDSSLNNGPFLQSLMKSNWDYQNFKKVIGLPNYNLNNFDVYSNQGFKVNNELGDAERYNYIARLQNKKINSKIVNVVFSNKYKNCILGDIAINLLKKDIIKTLGNPNFENKESDVFGYKLDEFYIFFIGKEKVEEVSIYKKDRDNKDILQKILTNKIKNVEISPEIISTWGLPDKYISDHGGFSWSYLSRGISCEGENDCAPENASIIIYGNYEGNIEKDKRVQLKSDKDLVFEEELSRVQKEKQYQDKLKNGKLSFDKSKILFSDVPSDNFESSDKNLYIAWKNTGDTWQIEKGNYDPIYGFKWLDSTHFIVASRFSISLGSTDTKKVEDILNVTDLTDCDKEISSFDEKNNTITLYSYKLNSEEKKITLEFSKTNELLNKEQIIKEFKK